MLAPTALSRKLIDMKLPYFFALLQQPDRMMGALVDFLVDKKVKTVAVIYMDDLFGLENVNALLPLLKAKGIQIVEKTSYPLGVKDLSPTLKAIKAKNVDAFLGITYPPDTILASKQSKEIGFAPKVFYSSVGTAFPLYKDVMGSVGRGRHGHGVVEREEQPRRQGVFPGPREEVQQGAGSLGQRPRLGRHADHATGDREGRPGSQGHPRLRRRRRSSRPSSARFDSRAARTSPRRERSASGRRASSRWCGRRTAPRPSPCFPSRRGNDGDSSARGSQPDVASRSGRIAVRGSRGRRPHHRRHLRAGRDRPQPAIRAPAHHEHRAWRVLDDRRLPDLRAADGDRREPALVPAGVSWRDVRAGAGAASSDLPPPGGDVG